LIKLDAAAFEEAWRRFCLLAEQIDFIDQLIYNGPPDEAGDIHARPVDPEDLEYHLREIAPLVDRLYYDFWEAFVPPKEEQAG
jgi:hypothetical protein